MTLIKTHRRDDDGALPYLEAWTDHARLGVAAVRRVAGRLKLTQRYVGMDRRRPLATRTTPGIRRLHTHPEGLCVVRCVVGCGSVRCSHGR